MLKNVHLQNLALIREADIDLEKGLNILTGETGAGKSIIIGSINIALGDKASKSFIRSGCESALVELLFITHDKRVSEMLKGLEIPFDENSIIISRRITPESSTSRINGTTVTLAALRAVTSLLVDIYGQHDNQNLLNVSRHIDIVDSFGGDAITDIKTGFHAKYNEFKQLRSRYRQFAQSPEELEKEKEFIRFELNEIETAGLKPGEDSSLETEYRKLSNSEKISEGLEKISSLLSSESSGVVTQVSGSLKELKYLITLEPELDRFTEQLTDLESISRDLSHDLSHYLSDNEFDPARFDEVRRRLDDINRLKSKYGNSIEEILKYYNARSLRLAELEEFSGTRHDLQLRMEEVRSEVNVLANSLSESRKKAAAKLEKKIAANLKDLNFLNAEFKIDFSKADKIYENGYDKVEFMLSTNVGEPLKPLARIASGGELSRIMLAIKASVADTDGTDTLIFDEIDTGISGFTAQKVAEKLALLSRDHQLICITHLPQIAAMADTHFSIEKSVSEGSTISGIRRLDEKDSTFELARLLSGSIISATSLNTAEELKSEAQKSKIK